MKFPVDLLADVSQMELERFAHNYTNNLLYSNPDFPERLTLSDSTQVTIDISSVGFVPLYGSSDKQKILALFSPTDPFTAVALYLLDQWWPVDDILKTADPARDGAVEVKTVGERIVLYILNRVIYRAKEMSSEELPFLCHGEKDHAKILWNNGQAVGFYSVKPTGSVYNSFSTRSYQLPVMDSIFVRKCQRGKGFGLQMLEDFVLSFEEDSLGFRYPLTTSMYKVCEKYLCQYPGDKDLLWEVEGIGGPKQRTNIASKIQAMEQCAVSKSLTFTEESLVITEMAEKGVVIEAITRSSGSKRRKTGEKIAEDKSEKVLRIEDIEAETPGEENVSAQKETDLHRVSELVQTEGMISVAPEERGEDTVDTTTEEAARMSDQPATVLAQQDLEEIHVTSASMTEEPQVEDEVPQDLTSIYSEPLITVENVASEIEGPEEEDQKEDTTVLVVSEEVLERHKEAETLDNVGEGTQIENTDEEKVTQQEVSLSTHASSEDKEALKAIKTVKSKAPRWRSKRQPNLQEGVAEKSPANDGRIVLRGRTVTYTPKRKYTQHSQKLSKEVEKEVDEEEEENKVPTAEGVEGLALTEGEKEEMTTVKEDVVTVEELSKEKQQLEDEQLVNEEPGVEDTMVKASFIELPDKAETELTKENEDEKVTDESEREQKGRKVETSVTQDKRDASPDEIQEPPAVQKKALRGRPPKCKPTKQSKKHEKQELEPTDEADQGTGGSASEESADQQPTDTMIDDHHKEVQEESVDKTEEKISTEELTVVKEGRILKSDKTAEDVIPSTEVNVEEELEKETSPAEETGGEEEEASQKLPEEKGEEIEVEERSAEKQKNNVEEEKVESAAGGESAVGDAEQVEDASTEAAAVLEEEDNRVEAADEINADTIQISSAEEEETTVTEECATAVEVESDTAVNEEEAVIENASVAAVEETCQKDEDKEQNMSEDEEEPIVIGKRVLRGRSVPSVTITTRRRSAKVQKAEESLSDEEKTSPSAQEKENTEPEAEMEKVEAVAEESPTEPEKVEEEQSAVSKTCADGKGVASVEESADETPNADKGLVTDEEETPTVETGVLTSGEKTVRATGSKTTKRKNDEQEEVTSEKSAEKDDEKGRRSAAVTDRRKSKRARTQCQTKEEGAKETSPAEETEAVAEAVAEESPTEPEIVEEEQSAVSKSCADGKEVAPVEESAEETPNADKGLVTDEEETPTVETGVLTSGEKTVTTKRRNCEQEEVTGEKCAEKDELVVETRVLRKGRKSAAATDRRKSKRSRTQCQTKEEGAKETSPAEETGGEEEEETQESPEVIGEETEAEERIVDTQRDNVEEEKVESAAGGESAVGDAEQVEDASTEVAAVLEEEDNRVEAADEINADTVQISSAEEEETTVTEECVTAAEVQSDTADVTGVADDATQEHTVAAALETIVTDPVPDETVVPAAEEPQKKNINSEIPKLQKATIILVDIKKTCCHLRVKQAEEAPADGECAAPEKQQEEENEGEQVTIKQKSSNATVEAGTVEKEVLEEDNSEKEKKESAIVNEEKSEAGEALVIETSVLQSGKETVKSNRGNRQKEEDDTGEGITEKEVTEVIRKGGTDEVEGEMESVANYAVIATVPLENKQSEICADREADIPAGGDAEDSLPPAQVDKAMSFEQEVSVVETRALKCETKSSTATPRHRRTRGGKQGDVQEAENSEEPPVTTRTLRSGRRSASNAQKGKSRRSCKKIQEDEPKVEEELKSFDETEVEQEKAAKETAVEKTDKEREGKNGEIIETVSEEAASEREESLQPEIDMEEGEAVVAQKQDVVEEQSETIPKTFAEREPEALGEECDESWKAGQAAAADDLVQGETGTPLPIPANDSATLPLSEEEATPSAEEQQLEENAPQLSDLRTMTVVLVDTKTKEEQREETIAQKNVCGSPELEKVTMEEQGYKDQVEIVTEQDTGEGRAEETAKEEEAKSANDDQEPSVTETRTQRNKKQEVKATPRSKVPRRRKKKTELEKEEALEIQKEEPAVQGWALRRGRMSILVAQRCSTKTTCKQLKEGEEAEDGEKSTEVQEREKEEKQQQFTHREKGEGAKEGDAAEQIENIDADIDKEETVTEEAVIQEDAPEEEQVNSTETVGNDNTEASVGQLAEGKTSDDAEEAVTTQDIDEREQPTSASKRVKSAAGEIAQETPLTAKDDKAKCVPQKEEASIIEKAQRSGEKTVRATGSKTTKRRNCQQEEVTGEKSTEEDELAVETRVLRKGRRSAAATDRRKSKRARTQCQTDEEGAKETSPAEETGVEEESPEEKEEEIEAEERNVETQKDDVKEEKVESAAGGESAVGDAEQVEDALTEAAAVLEKDNRVEAADEINADTVQISSAEEEETTVTEECVTAVEVESDTVVNEEEAEDASVAAVEETHQKDEDKEQNMSEDKEEPIVIGKRVLRGRSVPSVTITPRRRSAKVRKAEESLSDEEKNSSSARKRKTTKVTPTRTSKRLSRF